MTKGTKTELFKKLQVGTKVLTRWTNQNSHVIEPWFTREVTKVNSTGVQFDGESWLRRDAFKADQVYTLDMTGQTPDGKNVYYTPFADYSIVE